MKTQQQKAIEFKNLHERPGSFIIPNPWDPGTAKLLNYLGFEALATTSAGLAFSLGRPDLSRNLSRDEIFANVKSIIEATGLPVSADLENGYSDCPAGVYDTIKLAGEIGLVGASIEDATGVKDNPIYDFGLAVEKIQAAVDAKNSFDFPFMLTARSENFIHGIDDLDDTISRLQAYQEAGADVLYAPDLKKYEDIETLVQSVDRPINVMTSASFTVAKLTEIGVKRISIGSLFMRAALGEFLRAADEIKEKGTSTFANAAVSFGDLMEIFDDDKIPRQTNSDYACNLNPVVHSDQKHDR